MKTSEIVTYKRLNKKTGVENKIQSMINDGTAFVCIAGMLVSRGNLLGCMAPLGLAWYAANSGVCTNILFLSCALGTLFMSMGMLKIKYIVALFLFWVIRKYLFKNQWDKQGFAATVAAGIMFGVSFTVTAMTGMLYYDIIISIFEAAAVWGSCIIFFKVNGVVERKGQVIDNDESVAIAILAGAAVAGLQGAEFFEIKLGNILSMYIILFTAYKGGVGISGAAGAALGIITGMSQGDAPAITGVYAFVGLIAGVMNIFGKFGVVIAATLANSIFAAYYNTSTIMLINVFEILIAGVLFFLTSDNILNFFERFSIRTPPYNPAQGYMLRARQQAQAAFENLKTALSGMTQAFEIKQEERSEHKATILCDRLAARVCDNCSLNKYCWTKNFKGTSKLFTNIVQTLYEGDEEKLLDIISGRCVRGDVLSNTAINLFDIYRREDLMEKTAVRYSNYKIAQWQKLTDIIDLYSKNVGDICNGYESLASDINRGLVGCGIKEADISVTKNESGLYEVIIKTKKEIMIDICTLVENILDRKMCITSEQQEKDGFVISFSEKEIFEYDVAIVKMDNLKKDITGDSGHWFVTPKGKLYCIISDGMGSGNEASKDSEKIIKIFEKLAISGFEMKEIAKIINAGLISGGGQERCVTLDCACVNLFTGSVEMIKAGAAASIVKTPSNLEMIRFNSMPLGILDIDNVHIHHMNIEDNSYIVMMTDGVPDNRGDREIGEEFVRNIVGLSDEMTAKEMADSILMSSVASGKPRDDMMVLTTRIKKAS